MESTVLVSLLIIKIMVSLRHKIAFTILKPKYQNIPKGMLWRKTVVQKSSYELQAFNILHNLFLILIYHINVIFKIRFSSTWKIFIKLSCSYTNIHTINAMQYYGTAVHKCESTCLNIESCLKTNWKRKEIISSITFSCIGIRSHFVMNTRPAQFSVNVRQHSSIDQLRLSMKF